MNDMIETAGHARLSQGNPARRAAVIYTIDEKPHSYEAAGKSTMLDKIIEYLGKLIPFLEPYPIWVKSLIAVWVLLSAIILVALLFFGPTDSTRQARKQPQAIGVSTNSIITAPTIEQLRQKTGVRELLPLENDKNLSQLPNGVFGYTVPWIINSNSSGIVGGTGVDKISLEQKSFGTLVMEVLKDSHGRVYVVGFVSQEQLVRMQDPSRTTDVQALVFFSSYQEFNQLVALPLERIISSDNRTVENKYVNDVVFR